MDVFILEKLVAIIIYKDMLILYLKGDKRIYVEHCGNTVHVSV